MEQRELGLSCGDIEEFLLWTASCFTEEEQGDWSDKEGWIGREGIEGLVAMVFLLLLLCFLGFMGSSWSALGSLEGGQGLGHFRSQVVILGVDKQLFLLAFFIFLVGATGSRTTGLESMLERLSEFPNCDPILGFTSLESLTETERVPGLSM